MELTINSNGTYSPKWVKLDFLIKVTKYGSITYDVKKTGKVKFTSPCADSSLAEIVPFYTEDGHDGLPHDHLYRIDSGADHICCFNYEIKGDLGDACGDVLFDVYYGSEPDAITEKTLPLRLT